MMPAGRLPPPAPPTTPSAANSALGRHPSIRGVVLAGVKG
jgi:hypothetical protein